MYQLRPHPLLEKGALAFPREDEIAFDGSYPRRRPPYLRIAALSGFHSALVDLLQHLRNLSHVVLTILDEVGWTTCGLHIE